MTADSSTVSPSSPRGSLSTYLAPDDTRDGLRILGGLLLGGGLVMIYLRKSGSVLLGTGWSDTALFFVMLAATAFLYGVGMLGRTVTGIARPWQAVYTVFGVILAPITLAQFVQMINGTPGASLNVFWIFLVSAGLAAFAGASGFRFQWLLGSIYLIVSWSALWGKILSSGLTAHFGIYRGLLLILAAAFLIAGWALTRAGGAGMTLRERMATGPGGELVTGAAIAAVLAGGLSFSRFAAFANPFTAIPGPSSAVGWEIELLVVSLAAIAAAAWLGTRGPAYVGGFGLFSFLLIAGADLNSSVPHGKIVGWPLVLLILGAVLFVASLSSSVRLQSPVASRAEEPPAPPPPSPPPPSA